MTRRSLPWIAAALLAGGCASTQLDATWVDPQLPRANPLRGARVMIACDAYDMALQRLCRDRLADEVTARGATPVLAPDIPNPTQGRQPADDRWLPAARAAGATAVLSATVGLGDTRVDPGFSVGLGSIFGGSSRVGGAVGVSVPIGGGGTTSGHAASARITDVASGKLLWTARATTPPSSNLSDQMNELAKATLGAADKAGMF